MALSIGVCLAISPVVASAASVLLSEQVNAKQPLTELINTAIALDSDRKRAYAQSSAMREMGIARSTLMDPKLKVGFSGLPVDSFKFDQELMTNVSVGLMQQFERGSTLELKRKQTNQQAEGTSFQVQARELDIANQMTQIWLELGYLQVSERILRDKRRLISELERFIQTNYANGKSEAQDLLNAQLQVTKLDEKLEANAQMQRRFVSRLSEWLGADWLSERLSKEPALGDVSSSEKTLLNASNTLDWTKLEERLATHLGSTQHFQQLGEHPMVKMADSQIQASQTQIDIAEQAYNPQFGVEVMYAHRQTNNMRGEPASDLVSAYLTLDIPLFTNNRQDRNVSAAQYQVGAAQLKKDTLLQQMNAKVNTLLSDRTNLNQRLVRYQSSLMPQITARIRAVERGYQNNTAQFSDVIAASNDELALQLEQQRLVTDLNVVNSNLAALLSGFDYQADTPQLSGSFR
ncbi:TolC family protein [Vibrio sp. S9_S30]|uniref:TolC family protein n=1 Tax=Vibrio sp. S9_S30 TaxID=2720226 RepID=UPI00406C5499